MRLTAPQGFRAWHSWNYGWAVSCAGAERQRATVARVFAALMLLFSVTLSPIPVKAQQASQPGFDPRQTEKRFDASQFGQAPLSQSGLKLPRLSRPEVHADSTPLFELREVSLNGAHALPGDQLAAAYQSYLGKKVSQADLVAIAGAISDLYRAAGFHLSRAIVPPQDINAGRILVQVIEGGIVELALKGEGAEQFGVRPLFDPVLAEQPSRLATVERQLLLINGRPGVRIADTALEEIGIASGRFRLVVDLKTWHIFTSVGIDNLGSSSVGPWQTYATGAFNSYLLPGDTLTLNLSTIPTDPRELAFGRLSYDVPVGTDGIRIGASALYSEVRPGDSRRLVNDSTRTEAFEIRGSIIPLQSQASTLTLTAAAGLSNVSESDVFGPLYKDHIRTISLTSDYRLQDDFGGNNYITAMWRQGLDIPGASYRDDDLLSRNGASGKFSVMDFWFTRYQTLNDAWSVKMSAAGQIASGPLFTSQQFYLGGAAFGRGYGSAEISGDNGLAGSLEVRYDRKLNFTYLTGYQLYGFADAGAAWNDGYGFAGGLSLTSAGAGVRVFMGGDLRADLGVAVPLGYRAPDNSSRSARLLFSLSNALKLCPERPQAGCI
jgi:hemolysin activation/secretion protein